MTKAAAQKKQPKVVAMVAIDYERVKSVSGVVRLRDPYILGRQAPGELGVHRTRCRAHRGAHTGVPLVGTCDHGDRDTSGMASRMSSGTWPVPNR